ncbi:MAG: hemerythrin domain-containing protein [Acidobacteria bacterium]|nr:hemerythrin domain-containing protein [Acidobacteriota bacterium]
MSQIHPVQILLDEHRTIEGVLDAFEDALLRLDRVPFPTQWFSEALDFFRHFVEGCHHNKEEELFFPQLRKAGFLEPHESGVAYLERIQKTFQAAAGSDRQAIDAFRREGLDYVRFLRQHIRWEDELMHHVASLPQREEEIQRLQEGARPPQFHQMDEETYEKYLALAEKLSGKRSSG